MSLPAEVSGARPAYRRLVRDGSIRRVLISSSGEVLGPLPRTTKAQKKAAKRAARKATQAAEVHKRTNN
jgi:hypothetical protein